MVDNEQVIESTRAGDMVMAANAAPRCFRVVDSGGRPVTGPEPVDMATAFRVLDSMLRSTDGSAVRSPAGYSQAG